MTTGGTEYLVELGPLLDHHCHGLVTTDLDRADFEGLLSEAAGPSRHVPTLFDSMLGVAVRRWCAPVLDLEPHASPEDYLARRSQLGAPEINHRFVAASGITEMCVDTGLDRAWAVATGESLTTPADMAVLCGGAVHEVVRLETLAETLLADGCPPAGFAGAVRAALASAYAAGAVGAKSIAAYRVGLALPSAPPPESVLRDAVAGLRPGASGRFRIADPVVCGWLAWAAVEAGRPLQIHVGYGDRDVDLASCDPLLLTPFLRATESMDAPVMLLHNYPFHRHAAYLAQVFDHVFIDVGLAVHNTGALSVAVIRETLELAPFAKLLFSSDAFGLAELTYLGAHLFRRGFGQVLGELVNAGEMAVLDAERVAEMVARGNAMSAYRL